MPGNHKKVDDLGERTRVFGVVALAVVGVEQVFGESAGTGEPYALRDTRPDNRDDVVGWPQVGVLCGRAVWGISWVGRNGQGA